MLSRFLASSSRPVRLLRSLIPAPSSPFSTSSPLSTRPCPLLPSHSSFLPPPSRTYSSKPPRDGDGTWKLRPEPDDAATSIFDAPEDGDLAGLAEQRPEPDLIPAEVEWAAEEREAEAKKGGDIFQNIERELDVKKEGGADEWDIAAGFKPWGFGAEQEEKGDLFGMVGEEPTVELDGLHGFEMDNMKAEETAKLELQEKELKDVLKGPDRAFGDLIAASGITDEMLDSLILLKDVRGIEGLPSLREIEDAYIEKSDDTSRYEEEKKKQQDIAKARVKQVDEMGRAYGTGRRKCSIARVFIQPGDGKFIINDKQFDVYFPSLDHRAELLRPFNVTDTVGRWDVHCTVKGGGYSGQVGAIRLGISRALQNFEPGFRQYLRPEGFLTRDPRVVERKKPGKAKARKSFQWVKR